MRTNLLFKTVKASLPTVFWCKMQKFSLQNQHGFALMFSNLDVTVPSGDQMSDTFFCLKLFKLSDS